MLFYVTILIDNPASTHLWAFTRIWIFVLGLARKSSEVAVTEILNEWHQICVYKTELDGNEKPFLKGEA